MKCECNKCKLEKSKISKCLSDHDRKFLFEIVLSYAIIGGTLGTNI